MICYACSARHNQRSTERSACPAAAFPCPAAALLQVLLSYAIYPKPVGWKVLSGGLVVFLSLAWFHNQQRRGRGKAQPDLVVNCDLEDGNGFHKSASQITLSDWSDTGQGEGSSDSPAEVEADPLTPRFGSKALLSPTRR